MNKSESIKELASALSKAQGEFGFAKMNAVNPFLKNKYADLGEVIQAAKPALTKNGLSFTQMATTNGANVSVETVIMHSSGEWMGSTLELPLEGDKGRSLAQSMGAVITYMRRYALASALGIYADQDTDGDHSDGKKAEPKPSQPAQPNYPPESRQIDDEENEPTLEAIALRLVELKVVENAFHARGALKVLECGNLSEEDAIRRVRIYRAWREADPKLSKDDCKAKAIAGEMPA